MEVLDTIRDYVAGDPVIAIAQAIFLLIALLAVIRMFSDMLPVRKPKPRKDVPYAFNANNHPINLSDQADHGQNGYRGSQIDWAAIERRVK